MTEAAAANEPILEPDLPIVDPHHHLWDRRPASRPGSGKPSSANPLYLLDQLLADLNSGHNIRATVFLQCGSMYRAGGPPEMRPVGETEFVNGVAAMSASGQYGETAVCAGIVGHADLMLGDAVTPVLEAHIAAGGGRFRGVRILADWDADPAVSRATAVPGVYLSDAFRRGLARLAALNLSFDAWLLEPQLGDLIDLARAFPEQPIVLNHVGTPLGIGVYAGRQQERFGAWRESIVTLAESPNVCVKLGGLAMHYPGFPSYRANPPFTSAQLCEEWKPYIETCIEAFGADRCMFESNFPVDKAGAAYPVLWNAFKRLAAGCSETEKTALFSGTASRFYRLAVP